MPAFTEFSRVMSETSVELAKSRLQNEELSRLLKETRTELDTLVKEQRQRSHSPVAKPQRAPSPVKQQQPGLEDWRALQDSLREVASSLRDFRQWLPTAMQQQQKAAPPPPPQPPAPPMGLHGDMLSQLAMAQLVAIQQQQQNQAAQAAQTRNSLLLPPPGVTPAQPTGECLNLPSNYLYHVTCNATRVSYKYFRAQLSALKHACACFTVSPSKRMHCCNMACVCVCKRVH